MKPVWSRQLTIMPLAVLALTLLIAPAGASKPKREGGLATADVAKQRDAKSRERDDDSKRARDKAAEREAKAKQREAKAKQREAKRREDESRRRDEQARRDEAKRREDESRRRHEQARRDEAKRHRDESKPRGDRGKDRDDRPGGRDSKATARATPPKAHGNASDDRAQRSNDHAAGSETRHVAHPAHTPAPVATRNAGPKGGAPGGTVRRDATRRPVVTHESSVTARPRPNGVPAAAAAAPRPATASRPAPAAVSPPAAGASSGAAHTEKVWVNLDSKVYHRAGSRWYGKTPSGKYMSEADAIRAGCSASR